MSNRQRWWLEMRKSLKVKAVAPTRASCPASLLCITTIYIYGNVFVEFLFLPFHVKYLPSDNLNLTPTIQFNFVTKEGFGDLGDLILENSRIILTTIIVLPLKPQVLIETRVWLYKKKHHNQDIQREDVSILSISCQFYKFIKICCQP